MKNKKYLRKCLDILEEYIKERYPDSRLANPNFLKSRSYSAGWTIHEAGYTYKRYDIVFMYYNDATGDIVMNLQAFE